MSEPGIGAEAVAYSLLDVERESERAKRKWGAFRSTHEALGVMLEEFDEMKAAIHANDDAAARKEAMQLAAVAYRFARDGWRRD